MIVWDSRQFAISLTASVLILILLGLLISEAALHRAYYVWPVFLAGVFYYLTMRRYIKRRRVVGTPFPEVWRSLLASHVAYYMALTPDERTSFERDVQIFLSEQTITGVGVEVTDLTRLLVAASAVMLTFGWREWEYDNVPEILIYPTSFSEDFEVTCPVAQRKLSGMVAPQGAVIFSSPDLCHSFSQEDSYHVGLHEFAHLLDMEAWQTDGIPKNLSASLRKRWLTVFRNEMERARRGESLLREYAGENLPECFAVAVECFFKVPDRLREYDPILYGLLASYFNQDIVE
ncbi:MAG: zinc-dependent peptidase [Acidobacteria bacterium]|nr:zinc-dependent peptidase [Acidobacteriota bacterium]